VSVGILEQQADPAREPVPERNHGPSTPVREASRPTAEMRVIWRSGAWAVHITLVVRGPKVERPQTSSRRGSAPRSQLSGGRRATRAQLRATYVVPLGTTDRLQADALLPILSGDAEGPLPSRALVTARELIAGRPV